MRRFGEPLEKARRYVRRPGAYVVLWDGEQVLLTHQAQPTPEYQLPGGGIDPGEQPIAALHREVLEETGYRISNPVKRATYNRFTYMPEYDLWAEKICHIYTARPTLRIGPPTEPGHSVVWASMAEASILLSNTGDRHFLRHILDR